jgi:hypothetical protein
VLLERGSLKDRFGFGVQVFSQDSHYAVVVSMVFNGGLAESNGKIAIGKQIKFINGEATEGKSQDEVVGMMQGLSLDLALSTEAVLPLGALLKSQAVFFDAALVQESCRLVELRKDVNGLGFGVVGPESASAAVPSGTYVSTLQAGAPDDLAIGDRLVAVSDGHNRFVSLAFANQAKVQAELLRAKSNTGPVYLIVAAHMPGYLFNSAVKALNQSVIQLFAPANDREIEVATRNMAKIAAQVADTTAVLTDESRGSAPGGGPTVVQPPFFVEALFCQQATSPTGLSFDEHDILEVTAFNSADEWQARRLGDDSTGSIPSPSKYEVEYRQSAAFAAQQAAANALLKTMVTSDDKVANGVNQ